MNIENYIEAQYRKLANDINYEYLHLYSSFNHSKLSEIFSTLHSKLISTFSTMNQRLPTNDFEAHFWADPSRELISAIEIIEGLERSLKNTKYNFYIDKYYKSLIDKCKDFLSRSGGSTIPPHMDSIDLYYILPIFLLQNTIIVEQPESNKTFELRLIGEGSYAQVFKYFDEYYQKPFILKRAKKGLNEKEILRFKQEFEQMKNLKSPYIVEVYRYNDSANEYIMEYMDRSLDSYIQKNNTKLNALQRKSIGLQILKAFYYIHSKSLFHRDVSPKNILIKEYDDVLVVKVADFGLVKIPDSDLTTMQTEFKGYYNDPNLIVEGFSNYDILHETYALTRLIYFVMTGKTSTDKIKNAELQAFITKGLNPHKDKRFQNIDEIIKAFKKL